MCVMKVNVRVCAIWQQIWPISEKNKDRLAELKDCFHFFLLIYSVFLILGGRMQMRMYRMLDCFLSILILKIYFLENI